ncbi:MAG: tRNA (adenosine(37)-N6)-threonylcarbamoyltransferase complex ATPase subunit type 1 TsaE [Acidimicrobiales bacterium]
MATKSVEDTKELAAGLAAVVEPGDVILLVGDLGAGKTAFVQGFGRALGITEPITSPTFTLMRVHAGRLVLLHADVYRLSSLAEIEDLGLPELLDAGGVALIEWGDMAAPALAPDFLEVNLAPGPTAEERGVVMRAVGERWSSRLYRIEIELGRWITGGAPA